VSLEFFIDIKSYGTGVDSDSNRNEYREHFGWVKAAGAVVMKSGNLNFLEPSGPLQACNGTAFAALGSVFQNFMTSNFKTT